MPAQKRTTSKRSSTPRKPSRAAIGRAGGLSLAPARRRQLARDLGKIVAFVGGGAARSGKGDLAAAVDFPAFVAGLIDGVFQAIVRASIQQMDAYGDLLAGVARSADQFRKDNVSADRARDWLSTIYAELSDGTDDSDDEDDARSAGRRRPGRKRRRLTPAEQRALVGAVTLLGIDRLLLARRGHPTRRKPR
jgi:hypothetical protein